MRKKAKKRVWGKTDDDGGQKNLRIVWLVSSDQRRMLDELVEWSGNSITWWLNEVCSRELMKEWSELWEERRREGKQGELEGDE